MAYRMTYPAEWELCHDTHLILCVLIRRPIHGVAIDFPITCHCMTLWTMTLRLKAMIFTRSLMMRQMWFSRTMMYTVQWEYKKISYVMPIYEFGPPFWSSCEYSSTPSILRIEEEVVYPTKIGVAISCMSYVQEQAGPDQNYCAAKDCPRSHGWRINSR